MLKLTDHDQSTHKGHWIFNVFNPLKSILNNITWIILWIIMGKTLLGMNVGKQTSRAA